MDKFDVYCRTMPSLAGPSIFIDFEGNKDQFPVLLGVLVHEESGESFNQFILDDLFHPMSPSSRHPQLLNQSLEVVLRKLTDRYERSTPIYSWSTHEQQVIDEYLAGTPLGIEWVDRITDAKISAKKWARQTYPNHNFVRKEMRGKHTLDQYLELINYSVPKIHGAGLTGKRISNVRVMLEKGRTPDDFPRSVKTYWTNMLAHNRHDCFGLKALMDHVISNG